MRIEDVLQRVQGEFAEMPGLCLTAAQAQTPLGTGSGDLRQSCSRALVGRQVPRAATGRIVHPGRRRADADGPQERSVNAEST